MTGDTYRLLPDHSVQRLDSIYPIGLFGEIGKAVRKTCVGEAHVSTVFLSINHNFGEGSPILFETMIFGGDSHKYQERYATWDEAVAGHDEAVAFLQSLLPEAEVREEV